MSVQPGSTWTDERTEILKRLWGEGLNARQIAAVLGQVSRNAVIGKAHRMGLTARLQRRTFPLETPRPKRVRKRNRRSSIKLAVVRPPKPVVRKMPDTYPKPIRIHMIDIKDSECHRPLWGDSKPPFEAMFYCGNPIENYGTSTFQYCEGCKPFLLAGVPRSKRAPYVPMRKVA